jgi:hypothetical protein
VEEALKQTISEKETHKLDEISTDYTTEHLKILMPF